VRFLEADKSAEWANSTGHFKVESGQPPFAFLRKEAGCRYAFPGENCAPSWLMQYLAGILPSKSERLLWITQWGVWPSSENWPLYRRLRASFGDQGDLAEAPGHLFSKDEVDDLASFLQLAVLFGWEGYVLTDWDRAGIFFSHDEWFEIRAQDQGLIESARADFENAGYVEKSA